MIVAIQDSPDYSPLPQDHGKDSGLEQTYPQETRLMLLAGLRPTISHARVLQLFLADRQRWFDGEGIYRLLLGAHISTSLPSVYRSLKKLECHDLLLRKWGNGITGGKAFYILADSNTGQPRYDVICRYCGMTLPLQDNALVEHIRQFAIRNGQVCQHHSASIQMTCTRCDETRAHHRPTPPP